MLKELFFKKKQKIYSPVCGKTIPIEQVKDEVFSKKLIGDGIAIDISGDLVVAPCDGKVAVIMDTKHAIMMEVNGVELLIHIGIDTCSCEGEGFNQLVEVGQVVKKGTPLMKLDRKYFDEKKIDLTTMVILTNEVNNKITYKHDIDCKSGEDIILEY